MVSKTHTLTLGKSKNKIRRIVETSFYPEQKVNLPSLLLYCQNL